MSILSFDNGSNAKLRDSVAQKIYEHEYAKIVEMDMQFIPYQLAQYAYELADAFMAARKDSMDNGGLSEEQMSTPKSPPTIVGADFSGTDDSRWHEFNLSPERFRVDEDGNPVLTMDGYPAYKRGPKVETTH